MPQSNEKSTEVTKTQAVDVHGARIKAKSKVPAKKVAPPRYPHGEFKRRKDGKVTVAEIWNGLMEVESEFLLNEVSPPCGELQTPSRRRKWRPLSSSSAKESHKKIRACTCNRKQMCEGCFDSARDCCQL